MSHVTLSSQLASSLSLRPQPQRLPISVTSGCPLPSVLSPSKPPPVAFPCPVMSSVASQDTVSTTLHHSHGSIHEEDWDRSESDIQPDVEQRTPRNSVLFPVDGRPYLSPGKGCRRGDRTLSELLKLYAEKGTDCQFSQEEATRIADVLGQWVRFTLFPFLLRVLAGQLTQPPSLLDKFGLLPLRGGGRLFLQRRLCHHDETFIRWD